jgi:hypothetical protein
MGFHVTRSDEIWVGAGSFLECGMAQSKSDALILVGRNNQDLSGLLGKVVVAIRNLLQYPAALRIIEALGRRSCFGGAVLPEFWIESFGHATVTRVF